MNFTIEQLVAIMQQQEKQKLLQSTLTASLPASPSMGPATENTIITDLVEPIKAAKLANRCSHADCKRKLLLSDPTCRCVARFCPAHRMPEDHSCSFDYKAAGKTLLTANLVKVDGSKLERI
jgi:hypothetical protein